MTENSKSKTITAGVVFTNEGVHQLLIHKDGKLRMSDYPMSIQDAKTIFNENLETTIKMYLDSYEEQMRALKLGSRQ